MRIISIVLYLWCTAVALAQYTLPPPPAHISVTGDYVMPSNYGYHQANGSAYTISAPNVRIIGKGFGIYSPMGSNTLATGFTVVADRVTIENLELRGFHQLATSERPETVYRKLVGSSWYQGFKATGLGSLIEESHAAGVGGHTLDRAVYSKTAGFTLAGDGTRAMRCQATGIQRPADHPAVSTESMGFNVVHGAVEIVDCMASTDARGAPQPRTYAIWFNTPDGCVRRFFPVGWDFVFGIPSGAAAQWENVLPSRCNYLTSGGQ